MVEPTQLYGSAGAINVGTRFHHLMIVIITTLEVGSVQHQNFRSVYLLYILYNKRKCFKYNMLC